MNKYGSANYEQYNGGKTNQQLQTSTKHQNTNRTKENKTEAETLISNKLLSWDSPNSSEKLPNA